MVTQALADARELPQRAAHAARAIVAAAMAAHVANDAGDNISAGVVWAER